MENQSDKESMKLRLAHTLSKILHERRLTLKEVSKATAVSSSTLSEWTSGRTPKNPLQVAEVAKFLKVGMHELLFGKADENAPTPKDTSLNVNLDHRTYEVTIRRVRRNKGGA